MKTRNYFYALVLIPVLTFNVKGQDTKKANPIEGMSKFIGEWIIPKDALAGMPAEQRDGMSKTAMYTFEWAHENKTMRMFEMHPKGQKEGAVLEALIITNPVTSKIEFIGLNQQENFMFKGEFSFDGSDKMFRIYDVYYPPGYSYYEQGIASLRFRDTYTLLEGGKKIQQEVDYYSSSSQKWLSFTNGQKFIMVKN